MKIFLPTMSAVGMGGLHIKKRLQGLVEQGGLLSHDHVSCVWNEDEMRTDNVFMEVFGISHRGELIILA